MNKTETIYHRALRSIMTSVRLHHSIIERMVDYLGCHHSQHRMLFYLERNPDNPSQRQIADFMEISPACVAVTMKKMEKNGLIVRSAKKDDIRANAIEITPKARDIIDVSKIHFNNIEQEVFKGFSDDEVAQIEEYFARIKANLKNIDIKSLTRKAECIK